MSLLSEYKCCHTNNNAKFGVTYIPTKIGPLLRAPRNLSWLLLKEKHAVNKRAGASLCMSVLDFIKLPARCFMESWPFCQCWELHSLQLFPWAQNMATMKPAVGC